MSETEVDLGAMDVSVTYVVGGHRFQCFPIDECSWIDSEANRLGHVEGMPFLEIIQKRMATHGVKASTTKSWEWYVDMNKKLERQKDFTEGSVDTAVVTEHGPSTDPSPGKKLRSSNQSRTTSGRKSGRKTS